MAGPPATSSRNRPSLAWFASTDDDRPTPWRRAPRAGEIDREDTDMLDRQRSRAHPVQVGTTEPVDEDEERAGPAEVGDVNRATEQIDEGAPH